MSGARKLEDYYEAWRSAQERLARLARGSPWTGKPQAEQLYREAMADEYFHRMQFFRKRTELEGEE